MSAEFDRIKSGFSKFILGLMAPTDYHALYPAKVISQNGDGTLEIQPETSKLGPISKVSIMLGLPGASVTLAAGASVLLGFEAGDPSRPKVMLWGASTITTLSLNGGTVGLAKADHTHEYSLLSVGGSPTGNNTGAPSSNTTLIKVT